MAFLDSLFGLNLHVDWSLVSIDFDSRLVLVVPIESYRLGIADHHLLVVIKEGSLVESSLLWHRIVDHLLDIFSLSSLLKHLLYPLHNFDLTIHNKSY